MDYMRSRTKYPTVQRVDTHSARECGGCGAHGVRDDVRDDVCDDVCDGVYDDVRVPGSEVDHGIGPFHHRREAFKRFCHWVKNCLQAAVKVRSYVGLGTKRGKRS